jgi:hypothetical protein
MRLKTFKISFKLYHRELCDWSAEYVLANDRDEALRKFARTHGIRNADVRKIGSWRWWERDWFNALELIEQVAKKPRPCTRCNGTGTLAI